MNDYYFIGKSMTDDNLIRIQIEKSYLNFSAGHFTIFSATQRERLHGHNFRVRTEVLASPSAENGLTFDYGILKQILKDLCARLDEYVLLPLRSPFLKVKQTSNRVEIIFNDEKMSFPRDDVVLLELTNVTVEELSRWFIEHLLSVQEFPWDNCCELVVGVSSGIGQWGSRTWRPT